MMDNQLQRYRLWTMLTVIVPTIADLIWRTWLAAQHHTAKIGLLVMQVVLFVVFIGLIYLFLYHNGTGRWHSVLSYVVAIAFVEIVSVPLADMLTVLHQMTHWPAWIMTPLGGVLLLWIAFLFAKVVMPEIKATWGRILLLLLATFGSFGYYPEFFWSPMGLVKYGLLGAAINVDLVGILLFVLASLIFMPGWGLKVPHWRFNSNLRWPILTIGLLFATAYVVFNGFSTAESWSALLTHWAVPHYPKLSLFYQALEAGIGEEWLHRGLIVILLLSLPQRWVHRSPFTLALASGGLFGLWHFANFSVQTVPATINQMIAAFGFGLFMAALYFYSGSISLVIAIHSISDLLAFFASGTTTMTTPNLFDWILTIILVLLFAGFAALLTTGKQRAVAQQTLDTLM
ncbi:CPBP family intramembrane glutamic endopeptidase [Schleiferilactobacillus harbinensis]|jgi:membrane protease YdiL (CAAX protease family)|uniref:CPBP family intramembrane glutamic endopeptidase n=1 Tax=Schleiferilactobacillus harbinensis TaxID=304207 RepID=UPI000E8B07CB|nr:CPBP family intramembrane glutamic endopeptidase [Schleiferilactobacillus harbinensis]HAY53732.1 hypothetical protein [Lactobacillus sp.]MCI1686762.1 CPBP family intramembrane metalloprotease [Schleiferilactobacillus harbinensis]MCI1782637.1 CPBP family intramembrane metalloprotease [Schleiferilactobacillus harbinensis]MCI1849581.1 CPBP family intramembrane metalloprotease [Schleiferilactobacillus harbinensis]MCT2908861.1 CPBP family intramembrane metalloprotease [Schleiferilactobacillus ha